MAFSGGTNHRHRHRPLLRCMATNLMWPSVAAWSETSSWPEVSGQATHTRLVLCPLVSSSASLRNPQTSLPLFLSLLSLTYLHTIVATTIGGTSSDQASGCLSLRVLCYGCMQASGCPLPSHGLWLGGWWVSCWLFFI